MDIALIGIGGYGHAYIDFFRYELDPSLKLIAAVEPYPETASGTGIIREWQVPIYPTLEALYEHHQPELVIIASPIPYHKPQVLYCLSYGSHVLCEKPLTPVLEDALAMKKAAEIYHRYLGVGFQWSFSDTMLALKKDIQNGILKNPRLFKTHISWSRNEDYYGLSPWKGRIRNPEGTLIQDSIITNATAHYLHNVFFVNGASENTSLYPSEMKAVLKRTYDIETFDTCLLEGKLPNGCRFLHLSTHCGETNSEPKLEYHFDNAVIYYDSNEPDAELYAIFEDGTKKVYGKPLSRKEASQKVSRMAEAIRTETPPCCSVDTVLPHLISCSELFRLLPAEKTEYQVKDRFRYVPGLLEQIDQYYEDEALPVGTPVATLTEPSQIENK